jgi:hypothetical protein
VDTPVGPKPVYTVEHARSTYEVMLAWMRDWPIATVEGAIDHLAKRYGQADLPEYLQPMTWKQVGQLQDRGMEIGVHEGHDRLLASLRRVREETGCCSVPISHAAGVNGLNASDLEQAGGYCALVSGQRSASPGDDRFQWPTISVTAGAPSHSLLADRKGLLGRLARSLGLGRAAALS